MTDVLICGFLILLVDALLCSALWVGLVLLRCPSCVGLAGVWGVGAVKWVVLHVFTSVMTNRKPPAALCRLVSLHCILPPVFETGRLLVVSPQAPHTGSSVDLGHLLLASLSSSLACVVWEKLLCVDGKKETVNLDTRRLLMRTLKYFKPDSFYLISAFSFLILGVFCDTYIPLYQGEVIDMLRGEITHSSFFWVIGKLALFSLGSALFSGLRGSIFMCTLGRLNKRLKHLLFRTLLRQEVHFFDENKPGQLSSRLHSDVDRMGRTVALNANALVRSTVKTVLMLRVMLGLSWELTVLTCIEMPLLAFIQNTYTNWTKELKEQIQDCQAHNKDLALQTFSKIQVVRSFRAEEDELRRFKQALEEMSSVKTRTGVYRAVFLLIRRLVTLGIRILMLVQARGLLSSGRLSIGSLLSFFLYQKPMSTNLREILYCYGETMSTVGVISKVFSYLDREPKCEPEGDLAPKNLEGRISFENVTFTYPSDKSAPQSKPALKSVSLELLPGKMVALVGPSGSGKTSCVSLLKRLYEPEQGRILLDGEPLHRYKLTYLHQKMALVSQNPVLFSGSLRYNIEYGLKDCDFEKVKEAARKANADDFIRELEDGYDTDVGECGGNLSEGQRQIIAVLRALVRDPQVLILDEATSKLDVQLQHAVLQQALSRGRTVLVVAHQLKTVEKADHIIFMEDGEVVEQGTHQQLMAKRGRYHRLKEELFSQPQ